MRHLATIINGILALLLSLTFYLASTDIPKSLSPQGCRMSWMSPSYVLQAGFNRTWSGSSLAERYSLWLYREVGWEGTPVMGVPVLFIPGNAGSSHQVRSIASSAARQFYSSPYVISEEFQGRAKRPLDFYSAEFNEDLSAFHGPTLDSQISYCSEAIAYILSQYPPGTAIIVMGHSMGGIVATSLLPSKDISTIITMSTPHTLPPARFDSRIDKIYARNLQLLLSDPTPILSLCGGATDMMVPSESCILPTVQGDMTHDVFRRTVFTSALEGSWTGVGHREMVWCHQVRWRVARAALELGGLQANKDRAAVLGKWLRDGNTLPASVREPELHLDDESSYDEIALGLPLTLEKPRRDKTYLFPVPSPPSKFVLYASQGSVGSLAPAKSSSLHVSVYVCYRNPASHASQTKAQFISCQILSPSGLKLVPNPIPGQSFPVPDEGSDESEGVVVYEADALSFNREDAWVAISVRNGVGVGWVEAGFAPPPTQGGLVLSNVNSAGPLFGKVTIRPAGAGDVKVLRTEIQVPSLFSNALVVYKVTTQPLPFELEKECSGALLSPLLIHTSYPSETHYYPLMHDPPHPLLLHAHSSAPYIPDNRPIQSRGLNLTIYTTAPAKCISTFDLSIDWRATIGRWGPRYSMTILSWAVGVVALISFEAWSSNESDVAIPDIRTSLIHFNGKRLPKLLVGSFVVACLPLPQSYYLGSGGELWLAIIAPVLLFVVNGLVNVSWLLLLVLMWPLGRLGKLLSRSQHSATVGTRGTILSMSLILLLIFLFVPWQVAFLGCWLIHVYGCAISQWKSSEPKSTNAVPLISRSISGEDRPAPCDPDVDDNDPRSVEIDVHTHGNLNRDMHLLLLMTWLLPLVAPVLAVWVRTFITAGLTVPFDGDHNFLNVAPFLLLAESDHLAESHQLSRRMRRAIQCSFLALAATAFLPGPRFVHIVFDLANITVTVIVIAIRPQLVVSCFERMVSRWRR